MTTIQAPLPAIQTKPAAEASKPAQTEPKTQAPVLLKDIKKDDVSLSKQARGVSPIITIPGAAIAGGVIGGATGAIGLGIIDIATKTGSFAEAVKLGGGMGSVAGVVSGGIVANMAKTKLQATLYGALAGAGTGAMSGAVGFKNAPAALIGGAVGAVSGAVSGFTTSYLLGK